MLNNVFYTIKKPLSHDLVVLMIIFVKYYKLII